MFTSNRACRKTPVIHSFNRSIDLIEKSTSLLSYIGCLFLLDLQATSRFMTFPSSRPGETIVSVAAEHDADYIVLGTRGLSRLRLTISSSSTSVSEYVALNAHCPVIVCRNIK